VAILSKRTTCSIGENDEEVCIITKVQTYAPSRHGDSGRLFCDNCNRFVDSVIIMKEGQFCGVCVCIIKGKRK